MYGNYDYITSVAISSNNTKVVTGSGDYTAIISDLNTGSELFVLTGHTKAITSVAISNDNTKVVTGSNDKTAIIWNLINGLKLTTLIGHASYI